MLMPETCPVCSSKLEYNFHSMSCDKENNKSGYNVAACPENIKGSNERSHCIFFNSSMIDNSNVFDILFGIRINDFWVRLDWHVATQSKKYISIHSFTNKKIFYITPIPYFEPDLNNFGKVIDKIKMIITFS